jgi:hypothetical protein
LPGEIVSLPNFGSPSSPMLEGPSWETEKNSVKAIVFRVTPESGHCSMQSGCLKRAGRRHRFGHQLKD